MTDAPTPPVPRYLPFKREGWGVALFVCLLAVAAAGAATYVHRRTYKDPTDVRMRAAGADAVSPSGSPR